MNYQAYIFDLDGTLLDTLPDLVALTNAVLEENGMPPRTTAEINSYVGAGVRMLLKRAAPADASEDAIERLLARWKELYPTRGHALTKPYPGIPEALAALKARGAKLGVLSNKFDAATQLVISEHFPDVFDVVRGESPETPRKPDPTGLGWMMGLLGVEPARVAYVGDTGSDMTVAVRAGAAPVGVTWGYRSAQELKDCGALVLLESPEELASL